MLHCISLFPFPFVLLLSLSLSISLFLSFFYYIFRSAFQSSFLSYCKCHTLFYFFSVSQNFLLFSFFFFCHPSHSSSPSLTVSFLSIAASFFINLYACLILSFFFNISWYCYSLSLILFFLFLSSSFAPFVSSLTFSVSSVTQSLRLHFSSCFSVMFCTFFCQKVFSRVNYDPTFSLLNPIVFDAVNVCFR